MFVKNECRGPCSPTMCQIVYQWWNPPKWMRIAMVLLLWLWLLLWWFFLWVNAFCKTDMGGRRAHGGWTRSCLTLVRDPAQDAKKKNRIWKDVWTISMVFMHSPRKCRHLAENKLDKSVADNGKRGYHLVGNDVRIFSTEMFEMIWTFWTCSSRKDVV